MSSDLPCIGLLHQQGKTWLIIDDVRVCRVGEDGKLYFLDRDRRRCKEQERWEVCVSVYELFQFLLKHQKGNDE